MSVFISVAIIQKPEKLGSLTLETTGIIVKNIGWQGKKSLRMHQESEMSLSFQRGHFVFLLL